MIRNVIPFFFIFFLFGIAEASTTNNKIADNMIMIPAGCFIMGNNFGDPYHIEMPTHKVCLSKFYLSQFTVTLGEFQKFVNESSYKTDAEKSGGCYIYDGDSWNKNPKANWRSPGFKQNDNHPAVCISWNDANAYAAWLSQKNKKKYRLPTEAEWEYAARSGGKQERFAGGDDIDKVAWYASNSGNKTHPVGEKEPNGLRLYDMSGNVWQWTADRYDKQYYRVSQIDNPQGSESGTLRVFRGGSWFYDQRGARTTYRDFADPNFSSSYLGFRLVLKNP